MDEFLDYTFLNILLKYHVKKLNKLFDVSPLPYKRIMYRMKILFNLYNQLNEVIKN